MSVIVCFVIVVQSPLVHFQLYWFSGASGRTKHPLRSLSFTTNSSIDHFCSVWVLLMEVEPEIQTVQFDTSKEQPTLPFQPCSTATWLISILPSYDKTKVSNLPWPDLLDAGSKYPENSVSLETPLDSTLNAGLLKQWTMITTLQWLPPYPTICKTYFFRFREKKREYGKFK